MILGLPALRIRGLYLALLTFVSSCFSVDRETRQTLRLYRRSRWKANKQL